MRNKVLFEETQRFTQWWIWTMVLFAHVLCWGIVLGPVLTGDAVVGFTDVSVAMAAQLVSVILLLSLKLETKITEQGIDVRFFPFHIKFRHYDWTGVKEKAVRAYNPIAEYGGWGIRGFRKNRALNVSGNQGLQLVFSDGKRLLLGTRKPDEMARVLGKV